MNLNAGKTYLYNAIINTIRGAGKNVIAVAFTGIAGMRFEDISFVG